MEQNKDQIGAAVRGEAVAMTDEEIDIVWKSMPGGPSHWMKGFGYHNFARAIEYEYQLKSARAADAPSEPSDLLYAAVMNIPCERTMSHFVTLAELRAYKEGHHAARHAAVNLVAAFKSRAADALDSQPTEPIADVQARVRDAVAENLRGLYYCGRVWSAWSVGTMGEDDFSPAEEDDDIIANITDAVMAALAPASSQPTDADGCAECRHTYCMSGEVCKVCGDVATQGWKGGRQPTDGGVRNG